MYGPAHNSTLSLVRVKPALREVSKYRNPK